MKKCMAFLVVFLMMFVTIAQAEENDEYIEVEGLNIRFTKKTIYYGNDVTNEEIPHHDYQLKDNIPETVQELCIIAGLQSAFPEDDFKIDEFERLLGEYYYLDNEEESTELEYSKSYRLSEYLSIEARMGDLISQTISDTIIDIYLYIELPYVCPEDGDQTSVLYRLLLYQENPNDFKKTVWEKRIEHAMERGLHLPTTFYGQ